MSPIQWSDDLLTGNEELDLQHRRLFERINALLDACAEGKGRDEISSTIDYLEEYVQQHFTLEEGLMEKHGYSMADSHKAEHSQLNATLAHIRKQFDMNGPGPYLVVLTNRTVSRWLTNHIRKSDTELAAFLRSSERE